jgi:hypothetical protein
LADLATQSHFTTPLAAFRSRIALANAYGTDFQVPCSTAAFLSRTSSLHMTCPNSEWATTTAVRKRDNNNGPGDDNGVWMALAVQTPRNIIAPTDLDLCSAANLSKDEIAQRLDAMGWIKVFIDVRRYVPSIPIPSWLLGKSDDTDGSLEPRTEFTSHELWNRLCTKWTAPTSMLEPASSSSYRWWHVPFGHTVLVANAKNEWYAQLNAAGQPIMDALAKVLIQQVLSGEPTKVETSASKP